jgi:hypothetical protein
MDAATGTIRIPTAPSDVIDGFYVRPYPTQSSQDPLGVSTPPTFTQQPVANVLKRGFMSVKLNGATAAAKGMPVMVWGAAAAGGQIPGGVTAVTGASSITVPGTYFVGPADPGGFTEIAYNL